MILIIIFIGILIWWFGAMWEPIIFGERQSESLRGELTSPAMGIGIVIFIFMFCLWSLFSI